MTRILVDVDDELLTRAMQRYGLNSSEDIVTLALQRLVNDPLPADEALDPEGSGWDADLSAMREARPAWW